MIIVVEHPLLAEGRGKMISPPAHHPSCNIHGLS
jgi:hypothetical protein